MKCNGFLFFASMGEYHGAHPIRIGLVVGFQRGAKARLVSMKWSGFQGAGTPIWSMGFMGERSLPDLGGVGGSLEAPLTGDATAKRCTGSRITHHDVTPNKVVADAPFVGQKSCWVYVVRQRLEGCNGRVPHEMQSVSLAKIAPVSNFAHANL
jgi:hypothetical protein